MFEDTKVVIKSRKSQDRQHNSRKKRKKNRLKRRVLLEEWELFILPEYMISSPVFSGVRVTRSLDLCVCFIDRCLSWCSFFWPLYCLSFDLGILITPLVSPSLFDGLYSISNQNASKV